MYCMSYVRYVFLFFFKQKAAYERRISDWSSDVCSSDLGLWQKIQKINSDGYFLGCHYGLEAMKKRPNGSIVNMSSMAGIGGQSSFCAYSASKAAVAGWQVEFVVRQQGLLRLDLPEPHRGQHRLAADRKSTRLNSSH